MSGIAQITASRFCGASTRRTTQTSRWIHRHRYASTLVSCCFPRSPRRFGSLFGGQQSLRGSCSRHGQSVRPVPPQQHRFPEPRGALAVAFYRDARYHAAHHAVDRHWGNANFSTILSLWDRLFGTYSRPADSGATTNAPGTLGLPEGRERAFAPLAWLSEPFQTRNMALAGNSEPIGDNGKARRARHRDLANECRATVCYGPNERYNRPLPLPEPHPQRWGHRTTSAARALSRSPPAARHNDLRPAQCRLKR